MALSRKGYLSGDEWQRFALRLLRRRYGVHFVEFPDRDKGDLGLEGFTRDGCAYQCYGPEEPLDVSTLYEKQRIKITSDVVKLKKNAQRIGTAVGQTRLSRWFLMVPRHDTTRIVEHAAVKSAEVRSWNLPFIADDFEIGVITDDTFELERNALTREGLERVQISSVATTDEEATLWADSCVELVERMDGKLSKLQTVTSQRVPVYRLEWLKYHLEGENTLEQIRDNYADVYEQVVAVRRRRERALVIRQPLNAQPAPGYLLSVLDDLIAELSNSATALEPEVVDLLAYATIADWLLRCPLDFPSHA